MTFSREPLICPIDSMSDYLVVQYLGSGLNTSENGQMDWVVGLVERRAALL